MIDEKKLQEAIDRNEIENVIARSIIARDSGRWEDLADCYHPDARLTSSWFSGTPADFVEQASEHEVVGAEGETLKHMAGNHWIRVNGNRALAECDLILFQRRLVDGVELDFTTWSRRVHLMEKREGDWRIWRRRNIYEKDRMDPVNPDDLPAGFYASMDLSRYPGRIRHHCWRNDRAGLPPIGDSAFWAATRRTGCATKPASGSRRGNGPGGPRRQAGSPTSSASSAASRRAA